MASTTTKNQPAPDAVTARVHTNVTSQEFARLRQLAKADGRTLASYVRQVLRNHLEGE